MLKIFNNVPLEEQKKIVEARNVASQLNIVNNPEKFPTVAVESAQAAIDARLAKASPNVRQMWTDLKQAFKDDPASVGVELANSLMADPELLAAPVGLGFKVVNAGRVAKMGATAQRAANIANKITDGAVTAAGLNTGISLADQVANGRDVTLAETGFAAGSGAALGGFVSMFVRNAKIRKEIVENKGAANPDGFGEVTSKDFEDTIVEVAREENLIEDLINAPAATALDLIGPDGKALKVKSADRKKLETLLGIDKLDKAGRDKFLAGRREFVRSLSEPQRAAYFKAKAAERLERARSTSAAEAARAEQAPEAVARQSEVASALDETQSAKLVRSAKAVEDAEAAHAEAPTEETATALDDSVDGLNADEVIQAAAQGDRELNAAIVSAVGRDAKRAKPRYPKGEIDPELVARLGVGSLFAGTAYALNQDPDTKAAAAFMAGLTGLVLPGGGNVARRLRQSGAISAEGQLIGAIVKAGDVVFPARVVKLTPEEEAAQLARAPKARERAKATREEIDSGVVKDERLTTAQEHGALVDRIKSGDMNAFNELHKEFSARLFYAAKRKGLSVEDAEDAMTNAWVRIYQNLDSFDDTKSALPTWLQNIAEREAIRIYAKNRALKRGGGFKHESMDQAALDPLDGNSLGKNTVAREVDEIASDIDTPEELVLQEDAKTQVAGIINAMPKLYKEPFILARVEGMTGEQIAKELGRDSATIRKQISRADAMIHEALARGKSNVKGVRVAGGRKQQGSIDPELLIKGGAIAGFALVSGYLAEDEDEEGEPTNNNLTSALTAAGLTAAALYSRGGKKSIVGHLKTATSKTIEPISSRIRKISEPLLHRLQDHERAVIQKIHNHFEKAAPFFAKLDELRYGTGAVGAANRAIGRESEGYRVLTRAILTGKGAVTERILAKLNNPELIAAYKEVRSTLDSLGDQLVTLGRFKPGELEYFPRIVKDLEGLRAALGTKHRHYIDEALTKAQQALNKKKSSTDTKARELTDLEKSLIINKILREQEWSSSQPGFAKDRRVDIIPDKLMEFYYSPAESLHSYVRSAVKDIERARFFGDHLRTLKAKAGVYTNLEDSIGAYVNKVFQDKDVTTEQRAELTDLLKARFSNGEKAPHELIQMASNLSYASLLGNVLSATVQSGDLVISTFTQGLIPTLEGLVRTVSRNKRVDVRAMGMADHMAEEFANALASSRFVNKMFKYSLFQSVDLFGKNVVLNAAVSKFARLAKTEAGQAKLHAQYGKRLGPKEIDELINDLNKGEVTDLVKTMAFTELARTQPISKLEMPEMHLNHPNGRIMYQYKTFMIKQLDLLNQESLQLIKTGDPLKAAKGLKNLVQVGTLLGLAGAGTSYIKQYIKNLYSDARGYERQNVEMKMSDIPINMLKTFALSQYMLDKMGGVSKAEAAERRENEEPGARTQKATPAEAILSLATPTAPAELLDVVIQHDASALEKLPQIGWLIKLDNENKKAEEEGL